MGKFLEMVTVFFLPLAFPPRVLIYIQTLPIPVVGMLPIAMLIMGKSEPFLDQQNIFSLSQYMLESSLAAMQLATI